MLENMEIGTLFDVLLLIYGIYTVYTALTMRKTGTPGKWIIGEQEVAKCKDLPGFIEEIYKKVLVFGVGAILYGVVSIVNSLTVSMGIINVACIVVFLVLCGFFVAKLEKAKRKFF